MIFFLLFSAQFGTYHVVDTVAGLAQSAGHAHDQPPLDSGLQATLDDLRLKQHESKTDHQPDPEHDPDHETPYPKQFVGHGFPVSQGAHFSARQSETVKHLQYGIHRPPSPVTSA